MNQRQYDIVKVFADMKIKGQLVKIARVFKLPFVTVVQVQASASYNQFKELQG